MGDMTPEARAAYDSARATELRRHQYRTDHDLLTSICRCGVQASTLDIGTHIQQAASDAGNRAVAQLEGLRNL